MKRSAQSAAISSLDLVDVRRQVDVGVAALEAVLDLRGGKMMQHDLHHRELVQVGVEQRLDDHAGSRAGGRRHGIAAGDVTAVARGREASAAACRPNDRARWRSPAGRRYHRSSAIDAPIHAGQLRRLSRTASKLADIPVEDISDYVKPPRLLRLGGAVRSHRRPSSTRWREEFGLHELAVEDARNGHQRPKIEEYGDSLFAVLHTVEHADADDELHVGEIDVFVGPNYVLSVRHDTQHGLRRRARAHRARARPAEARRRATSSTR